MIDKIIVWFRNNWFLWVVLIAGYIVIRAFGYDIKVINPQAVEKAKIQEDTINDGAEKLVDLLDFPVTQNDLVKAYNLLLPYSNNKRGMDILNAYKNSGKMGHTDLTTTLKYIPTIGVQSTDIKNKLVNLVNRVISGTNGNRPIATDKKLNDDVEEMIDLLDFPVSESNLIDAYNLYLPYSKNGKGDTFLKLYEKSGFGNGTLLKSLNHISTLGVRSEKYKNGLIYLYVKTKMMYYTDKNLSTEAPIDNTQTKIGTFTTKTGTKSVLNAEGYRNLLIKGVLTSEEKKIFHIVNKNIVKEMGAEIFIVAIKDVTKGLGRLESIALESKILDEFFDKVTSDTIKSSLNIGRLKQTHLN